MPVTLPRPGRYVLVAMIVAATTACLLHDTLYSQPAIEDSTDQGAVKAMNNERLGELLKQHFPKQPFRQNAPGVWIIQVDGDPDKDANAEEEDETVTDEREQTDEELSEKIDEADAMNGLMVVMTDERANRMRIMMPIQKFDPANAADLKTALIALHANYDRALDARYAVSDGILWSVFIHPLGSLTEGDLAGAILQVRTLRKNTGTTYSSGAMQFAPRAGGQPADEAPPIDPTI